MRLAVCAAVWLAGTASAAPFADRFVWLFGLDLEKPADAARAVEVLRAGAAHGLNGAVLPVAIDALGDAAGPYRTGLDRVRQACADLGVELIPAGFSFGYGGPFLGRNRNLAEGFPVRDALFVAGDDGVARFRADPPVGIPNGGFEAWRGDTAAGFGFQDAPGVISFRDPVVKHAGAASLRLTGFAADPHGHGRVHLKVAVRPHRCYRVSIWARSQGRVPADGFNLLALAPGEGERSLAARTFDLAATQDWTRFTYLFNSREFAEVSLYAGQWEGKSGTLWLDDWTIEETGPVNLLRRPGTPVAVRSEGGTAFAEGRDFARFADPDLHPWNEDKPAVDLHLLPAGRIRPGERLRVSWYHPLLVYRDQVGVCMAEPEIYEIARAEARALVAALHPKRVLLNMDEIRFGGTCEACRGRDMARLLGESVGKIAAILRAEAPGVTIYCWADMFDPNHNAHGQYYYVDGDFTGSWTHLPPGLVMAVWGGEPDPKSLAFFAARHVPVLGACYYDEADLAHARGWADLARRDPNVRGLMYTTWEARYDLLPAFADLLR